MSKRNWFRRWKNTTRRHTARPYHRRARFEPLEDRRLSSGWRNIRLTPNRCFACVAKRPSYWELMNLRQKKRRNHRLRTNH